MNGVSVKSCNIVSEVSWKDLGDTISKITISLTEFKPGTYA
jgi:hypothetical protein